MQKYSIPKHRWPNLGWQSHNNYQELLDNKRKARYKDQAMACCFAPRFSLNNKNIIIASLVATTSFVSQIKDHVPLVACIILFFSKPSFINLMT
jgi:hypothetical protein